MTTFPPGTIDAEHDLPDLIAALAKARVEAKRIEDEQRGLEQALRRTQGLATTAHRTVLDLERKVLKAVDPNRPRQTDLLGEPFSYKVVHP